MRVLLIAVLVISYVQAVTLPVSARTHFLDDASLLWGPYRPNLYLGLRPRLQRSLMIGFMWYSSNNPSQIEKNIRHTCEQNEGMASYGWTTYDVRSGGTQVINDTGNGVDLVSHFDKFSTAVDDQRWGLRIRGKSRAGTGPGQKTTMVFYVAMEDPESSLRCDDKPQIDAQGPGTSYATCEGTIPSQFDFKIDIIGGSQGQITDDQASSITVHSLDVDPGTLWKAKDIFLEQLKTKNGYPELLPNNPGPGNLHFMQMTFHGDSDFNVLYHSGNASKAKKLSVSDLEIKTTRIAFEEQFSKVYQPQHPFQGGNYGIFSKSLLSNLMGGIGFFEGMSKVSSEVEAEKTSLDSADIAVTERGPYELFSAVPSRPFFPRGFLWDEGYHLQAILDWDMDLAMTILTSWLDLMDDNGWIAREQILGPEARSKVPIEFQTQYQQYANPPTMFRVLEMFVDRITGAKPYTGASSRYVTRSATMSGSQISEAARLFLEATYQKLKLHYEWFIRTQAGKLDRYGSSTDRIAATHGYRWRGRTPQHILASGLDDYPRAPTPSEDELHLDALSWVGFMTKILHKTSLVLDRNHADTARYLESADSILITLDNIHWSETEQAYCDTTIDNTNPDTVTHICHKGYISLLPFLTGILPTTHPHLPSILSLISSPSELWSPHGLRSLSLSSPLYGTAENYWRGPIWVNLNYMALEQLLHLSQQNGPLAKQAASLYVQLRRNIVRTVYQSWKDTGFAWEQYNAETGKGQRTQHFTGWTALVVRIMAMSDLQIDEIPATGESVVESPLDRGSWSMTNLLFMLTGSFVLCFMFRRRLFRVWRGWLEDR